MPGAPVADGRSVPAGPAPLVRIVVLNWNGGELTLRCLQHLHDLNWPGERRPIVVVDNASTDGSIEAIEQSFPDVEIRRNDHNGGFPANNLALADLTGVDYVALVNNDAFVEPGWLTPLVETLEGSSELGAASSKLVLAPRFVDVRITTSTFVPGPGDGRQLGVMVRDLLVAGCSVWSDAHIAEGGWGPEQDRDGAFEWTNGSAVLRVPVPMGEVVPTTVRIVLQAERRKEVRIDAGVGTFLADVDRRPTGVDVSVQGQPYDVVNNVGSVVYDDGAGADRGWLDRDEGQYDAPADVFAWCGGSVLLRPAYLRDVGLFDERFFLYYEDTDLSWRGRLRGWGYRTAPASVARHVHAATSQEGSPVFAYHVERNRLLMLLKNAPARMAAHEIWRFVLVTGSYARRDVVRPLMRARRPNATTVRRRLGSFAGFVRLSPSVLASRRHARRHSKMSDTEMKKWLLPR